MYSKKFDEFQGTVSKSNSVYSGFKQDMDKVRMAFCNVSFQFPVTCKAEGSKNRTIRPDF